MAKPENLRLRLKMMAQFEQLAARLEEVNGDEPPKETDDVEGLLGRRSRARWGLLPAR